MDATLSGLTDIMTRGPVDGANGLFQNEDALSYRSDFSHDMS